MESMPHKKIRIRTEPWHVFRQKEAVTAGLESRGTMYRKGLVSKNRYEAELTNQRRGSGSKT